MFCLYSQLFTILKAAVSIEVMQWIYYFVVHEIWVNCPSPHYPPPTPSFFFFIFSLPPHPAPRCPAAFPKELLLLQRRAFRNFDIYFFVSQFVSASKVDKQARLLPGISPLPPPALLLLPAHRSRLPLYVHGPARQSQEEAV